jgi:vacuolar protein sorting-associated protein 13A/C
LSRIKWNTLSFLGASNLIGNPVKFIDTLGTGFEEFYYEPYEGFMRGGVMDGSLGIARGTASLVKNTFSASVGSIGKISSSLSAGMLAITGDDQFI